MNYNLTKNTNDKPTSTSTPLKFEQNYLIQNNRNNNNNVFIQPEKMTHIELEDETQQQEQQQQLKSNRKFLGNNAVAILLKWFHSNKDYPYPDEATTDSLAKEANISCKQVKKWFANKRVRSQMCCKPMHRQRKRNSGSNQGINDDQSMSQQSPQNFNLSTPPVPTPSLYINNNNITPKTPINRNIYQHMPTTNNNTVPLIQANKSLPQNPAAFLPNMIRNGLHPNIIQLMALYNPLLMMNAVLATSASSSPSIIDHNNNNQNIINKSSTTTTTTATITPSPSSSSPSVSPYSSISPSSSSMNSSSNNTQNQNTPNTKIYGNLKQLITIKLKI